MSMFCFQCQEAARNEGCSVAGACGKQPETSRLMDLLVFNLKGVALLEELAGASRPASQSVGLFIAQSLFLPSPTPTSTTAGSPTRSCARSA